MPETHSPGGFSSAEVGSPVQRCPQQSSPTHWIEIEMVGEDDSPVPWLLFEVKLPNGVRVQGCLDEQGFARLDKIPSAGLCEVTFPEFDRDVWHAVTTLGPAVP